MARSAAHISSPCGCMARVGRMKPAYPTPRNPRSSTVYEYLMFATPFAQSPEPPEAPSVNAKHVIICRSG